jgi:phosphoribosylformimino-5-aminoimidazole carboxamide ribotide isomerase
LILLPAIDILGGKAVRLDQGDYGRSTEYDADPLDAALRWVESGARALHVVDLDGARSGAPANLEHVRRIAAAVSVPVELGGGLRNLGAVDAAFAAGVGRVILGTAAFRDIDFLDAAVAAYGERVVVSVDGRDGKVAAAGWIEQTTIPVVDAIARLSGRGVRRFVYSSIERDGMLSGPDLDGAVDVAAVVSGTFVYSGGVSSLADLEALAGLRQVNLTGVIVGKALFERKFEVGEAQALLDRVARA